MEMMTEQFRLLATIPAITQRYTDKLRTLSINAPSAPRSETG